MCKNCVYKQAIHAATCSEKEMKERDDKTRQRVTHMPRQMRETAVYKGGKTRSLDNDVPR